MDRRQESGPLLTLQPSASPLLPPHDLNPASHDLSCASTPSRHLDISKILRWSFSGIAVQYPKESIRSIFGYLPKEKKTRRQVGTPGILNKIKFVLNDPSGEGTKITRGRGDAARGAIKLHCTARAAARVHRWTITGEDTGPAQLSPACQSVQIYCSHKSNFLCKNSAYSSS